MSALDELRTGDLGNEFAMLLYRTIRAVGRSRNFPAPGRSGWDRDAVHGTAHEFLVSTNAKRRLTELAVLARDDDELSRLLQGAVRNFMREQSRHTTIGRLVRRLKDVLGDSDLFTLVPARVPGSGQVTLAATPDAAPFGGRLEDLVRAAWTVTEVTVVRWSADTDREPPIADRDSIIAVASVVLEAADASLRWDDLARVIAARFGVSESGPPAVTPVDDVDTVVGRLDRLAPDPTADAHIIDAARAVIAQLSDREFLVLAHLEKSGREIARITGLPTSTAAVVKQRVIDKMRVALCNEDAADDIVATAIALALAAFPTASGSSDSGGSIGF